MVKKIAKAFKTKNQLLAEYEEVMAKQARTIGYLQDKLDQLKYTIERQQRQLNNYENNN